MSTILNVNNNKHSINFSITMPGNIQDMDKEEMLKEIRVAFDRELNQSCEYMIDFSIGEDQDKIHDIIEKSKEIVKELKEDKILMEKGSDEINTEYKNRIQQYLMYQYQDGRDLTSDLAHDIALSITVGEDGDLLEDLLGEDDFTSIRDEIMFSIEEDLDRNLTINDLVKNTWTEFMYLPGYENSRSVIEDKSLNFEGNTVFTDNLIMDEGVVEFFSMINVNPSDFADYLERKGKNSNVVDNYRSLKVVEYSEDRKNLFSMEQIETIIDNSYTCAYPTVFAIVSLGELLDRDITKGFYINKPLVGLHDFVNGAGHIDKADANFEIGLDDFNFTGGKAYRYSVDEVYGFTSSYSKCSIEQPLLAAKYHEKLDEIGLLGKAETELQTKSKFEGFDWGKPDLIDKESGFLMRSANGGGVHLRSLENTDALILCAIHEKSQKLMNAYSSKVHAERLSELKTIETKFSVNVTRLRHLGLVESWCIDGETRIDTTYAGKVFYEFESKRVNSLEKEIKWFGESGTQGSLTM